MGTVSRAFRWSPISVGSTNIVAPRIFAVDYVLRLAGAVRTVRCVFQHVFNCAVWHVVSSQICRRFCSSEMRESKC